MLVFHFRVDLPKTSLSKHLSRQVVEEILMSQISLETKRFQVISAANRSNSSVQFLAKPASKFGVEIFEYIITINTTLGHALLLRVFKFVA